MRHALLIAGLFLSEPCQLVGGLSARAPVLHHSITPHRVQRARTATLDAISGQKSRPFPDQRTRRLALEAAFTAIDLNRDESVDMTELTAAGFDAELVIASLDKNKDGELSRDEFVDSWLASEISLPPGLFPDDQSRRVALQAAFDQIDADDSASLDVRELQRAGFDAEVLLARLDANRDGLLSRDEFVEQMLEQMLAQSSSEPAERASM